jgi:hypothetical protein
MARIYYDNPAHDGADDEGHWEAKRSGVVGDACNLTGAVIALFRQQSPTDACAVCTVSPAMRKLCNGRPMKGTDDRKKVLDAVKHATKIGATNTTDESGLLIEARIRDLTNAFKMKE